MDSSYTNSFGQFGASASSPNSGVPNGVGPIMSAPSEPVVSGGNDIVLAPSGGSKKKRWPLVVGIVLILIAIGAGVGAWTLTKNMHESKKASADELVDLLGWVSYTGQCPMVIRNYNDIYTEVDQYNEYLQACKSNSEKVSIDLANIKDLSGDREYTELYSKLQSGIMNVVLFGEELDNALKIYDGYHNFMVGVADMGVYQTDYDIEKVAGHLVSTGDPQLIEFAEKWTVAMKELSDASFVLNTNLSNQENIDRYDTANDSYEKVMTEMPDIYKLTKLNNEITKEAEELNLTILEFSMYIGDNI